MSLRCDCGYDLLNPSGNSNDSARCAVCSWQAGGMFAEHAGFHHWLTTGHHWYLTVFRGL